MRRAVAQVPAKPVVEQPNRFRDVKLACFREVGLLGKVMAQQPARG